MLKPAQAALLVTGLFSLSAQATLVLDQGVTETFYRDISSTGTNGNDLPGRPNTLYFGQLQATAAGFVDFYYIGHEAGYTNSFVLGGSTVHATNGLPDNFKAPYPLLGSVGVGANELVDFGFCTDGGNTVGGWGRCAHNDVAASLTAQFNYDRSEGYRSVAFRPLDSFDPSSAAGTQFRQLGNRISDLWMVFWDDSGAKNDDNHDDYIAVASFRQSPVSVPEPTTALLVGGGLLALGLVGRRRRLAA